MKIKISGKDLNSIEYYINLEFDLNHCNLTGSHGINLDFQIDEMTALIDSYEPTSLSNGIPPEQRDYFKKLKVIPYNQSTLSNVYRSFPIILQSIHFNNLIKTLKQEIPSVKDYGISLYDIKKSIYDSLAIEKTGTLGVQPTLYFIKESLIINNQDDLTFIFDFGLIFKLETDLTEKHSSFFLPFNLPRINRLTLRSRFFFWNDILTDREKKIDEFSR